MATVRLSSARPRSQGARLVASTPPEESRPCAAAHERRGLNSKDGATEPVRIGGLCTTRPPHACRPALGVPHFQLRVQESPELPTPQGCHDFSKLPVFPRVNLAKIHVYRPGKPGRRNSGRSRSHRTRLHATSRVRVPHKPIFSRHVALAIAPRFFRPSADRFTQGRASPRAGRRARRGAPSLAREFQGRCRRARARGLPRPPRSHRSHRRINPHRPRCRRYLPRPARPLGRGRPDAG